MQYKKQKVKNCFFIFRIILHHSICRDIANKKFVGKKNRRIISDLYNFRAFSIILSFCFYFLSLSRRSLFQFIYAALTISGACQVLFVP